MFFATTQDCLNYINKRIGEAKKDEGDAKEIEKKIVINKINEV